MHLHGLNYNQDVNATSVVAFSFLINLRSYEFNGRKIKEGIYSPITQNERHMNVIRELQNTSKTNFITRKLAEKSFARDYKGIVVLANPKTCLNARFAKKEVKEQVIRADQLISYIRNCDAEVTEHTFSGILTWYFDDIILRHPRVTRALRYTTACRKNCDYFSC